jgi:hypothetical protein
LKRRIIPIFFAITPVRMIHTPNMSEARLAELPGGRDA